MKHNKKTVKHPGDELAIVSACLAGPLVDHRYIGYLGYPFEKCAMEDSITSFFAPVILQAENDTVAHCAVYLLQPQLAR